MRTRLDELVRRSLLRYPLIFTCRWDVLRHLYLAIGNGYEWHGGELVDVMADVSPYPGDEACRSSFFDDLDDADREEASWQERFPRDRDVYQDARATVRRARRQFALDNLDVLVHERGSFDARSLGFSDVASASTNNSHAFNVPDDAEESFKAGAIEVLDTLIPALHYASMRGWDDGLRDAAGREKARLAPVDHAALQGLIARVLNDDSDA